jgi:hypothetical protein
MKKESFEDAIPKPSNIYFKLWKAKHEIKGVTKGKDNPFFKSKYADLNAILDAVEPILLKYDLIILQPILDGHVVTQIIDCENGDMVESRLHLPVVTDPQKQIAGVTYFRRATLQSLLSLQALDSDGNEIAEAVRTQKPKLPQANFEKGLSQVEAGSMTKEQFKAKCDGFELTDVQSKVLQLL